MERKYPVKFFCLFVITNFLFHYFYLFFSGMILCIIGIWSKPCLAAGLVILILDLTLSVIEQLKLRRAAVTKSDSPEFNKIMDAFCSPGGLHATGEVLEEMLKNAPVVEETEKNQ